MERFSAACGAVVAFIYFFMYQFSGGVDDAAFWWAVLKVFAVVTIAVWVLTLPVQAVRRR